MTAKPEIRVGQKWLTRGGMPATINRIDNRSVYCVESTLYGSYWHFVDGRSCLGNGLDHKDDLVKLVQDSDQDPAAQLPRQQALDACATALAAGRLTPDEAGLIRCALEAQA